MKKMLNKKNIIIGIVLLLLPIIIEMSMFKKGELNIKLDSILRLGYMYSIYALVILYKILDKYSNKLKKVFDALLKYRYVIGIAVFLIMVMCKLSISSIGMWRNYVPSEENKRTTILGVSRSIRSDEWLVQSSFFLAQTMNDSGFYPLVNKNVRATDGQNMLMVYAAPVANITILGKPQNLGFLLLGRDYGFSWYWSMKIILLILFSIEIAMILSKKDSFLSIIGGLWLAFSPGIMWWLSSTGDIYLHGFAIIVIFYYYMENTDWKIWKKALLGLAMLSSIAGFVFCFYPPLQVPIAYVILAFILVEYIKNRKELKKIDYIIMGGSLLLSLGLVGYYYYLSKDAINLMLNTAYPGKRNLTGGGMSISYSINYFTNFFTPISSKGLAIMSTNSCEISSFIYPFVGLFVVIISYFKNFKEKIKDKENHLLILLILVFMMLLIWCFVGFGSIISKLTLFYMCQPTRVYLIFGMIGVMISIIFLSDRCTKKRNISKIQAIIISTIVVLASYILINIFKYSIFLSTIKILVLMPIVFSMTYFFIRGNKRAFLYIMSMVIFFTGMVINPVEHGTGAVYNTNTSKEIQKISSENKSSLWIGETSINAQYLIANGAKTLNGVNYYPNFDWIQKLDPDRKYEDVYNRYAHISVNLADETKFKLSSPDSYIAEMTYHDLKEIDIKYLLANENIDQEKMNKFKLNLVFSSNTEGQYIYSIN